MTRLESVDMMRGVAALSVALYHFTSSSMWSDGLVRTLGSFGWLGVEVFFVITGFIVPMSMWSRSYRLGQDSWRFAVKRLIRLEPPYIISVFGCLALWHLSALVPGFQGESPDISITEFSLHFGYLNAFFGYGWLNPVFWTLAIEFQFYFLIAIVYPLLSHQNKLARILCLVVLVALSHLDIGRNFLPQWLGLFCAGMVAWMYHSRLIELHLLFLLIVAIFISNAIAFGPIVSVVGVVTAVALLVPNVPRVKPVVFLGAISYSLYLVHVPIGGKIINLFERLPPSNLRNYGGLLFAVVISIVAAYIMYKTVELPSQRLSQNFRYGAGRQTKKAIRV